MTHKFYTRPVYFSMRGNLPEKFQRYDNNYVTAIYRRPLDVALALVDLADATDALQHMVVGGHPDDTLAHAQAALEARMAERRSHLTTAKPDDLSPSVEQQARTLRKFALRQAKLSGIDIQKFDQYMPDEAAFDEFHRHVEAAAKELGFDHAFGLLSNIFKGWAEKEWQANETFSAIHDMWMAMFAIDPDGAKLDGYNSRMEG